MFRGRGSSPSIGGSSHNSTENNLDNDETVSHYHPYIDYWSRNSYYYHYDRNFVAMEIGITAFILLICLIIFILAYKTSFVDPIETIKRTYIISKLIVVFVTTLLIACAFLFSKSRETLIKSLAIILLLSIVSIIIFMGIKFNFDTIYNENKFSELYETSEIKEYEKSNKKQNISIGLDGIKLTDLKQSYIDENIMAYKFFSYKSIAITTLYIIVIVFNIAMIIRLFKMQEKNERLNKDDSILFDEEKNIKI